MMVMMPLSGYLSDRYPAGILGAIGMTMAVAGMLAVAFLPAHPVYIDIFWRMLLCGFGYGLFLAPNGRIVIGSAPRARSASAGGLLATSRLSGQTFGATLVASLLALELGSTRMPAFVAASLAGGALICSIARLRPSRNDTQRIGAEDAHIDII